MLGDGDFKSAYYLQGRATKAEDVWFRVNEKANGMIRYLRDAVSIFTHLQIITNALLLEVLEWYRPNKQL